MEETGRQALSLALMLAGTDVLAFLGVIILSIVHSASRSRSTRYCLGHTIFVGVSFLPSLVIIVCTVISRMADDIGDFLACISDLYASGISFFLVTLCIRLIVRIFIFIGYIKKYREMKDKSWMRKNELYP